MGEMSMEIRCVGVVGCGVMGGGIAQLCAAKGYRVVVIEKDAAVLKKGVNGIESAFEKLAAAGKITQIQQETWLSHVHADTDFGRLDTCDFVIEAVTENLALKKSVFKTLDGICPSRTIFATNTSVLPVIEMAHATARPEKVIGTHFLTPPPVIPLLELVRTLQTSDDTVQVTRSFGETLGKKVIVSKDTPGFIVNRVLTSILFNAVRLYEQGIATKQDIDTAMTQGLGLPMGPFGLIDLIGMDTIELGSDALFSELNEDQYRCPVTIRRMVSAGMLGRKSGKGFYDY